MYSWPALLSFCTVNAHIVRKSIFISKFNSTISTHYDFSDKHQKVTRLYCAVQYFYVYLPVQYSTSGNSTREQSCFMEPLLWKGVKCFHSAIASMRLSVETFPRSKSVFTSILYVSAISPYPENPSALLNRSLLFHLASTMTTAQICTSRCIMFPLLIQFSLPMPSRSSVSFFRQAFFIRLLYMQQVMLSSAKSSIAWMQKS